MYNQQLLIEEAFKASENAYAPYSKFKVGACVLLKNGQLVHGCNIENASYGATMCAERNAVFATYALGYHKNDIEALCIVSYADRISAPCGICRQVLNELLNKDTPIILSNGKETVEKTITELLPMSFEPEDVLDD